jgi:hypothetical protein
MKMWAQNSVAIFLAAGLAAAGPTAALRPLTHDAMLENILKAPHILPPRSYEFFQMQYAQQQLKLQKRQASFVSGITEMMDKLGLIASSLPGIIATGQTSGSTNLPKTTVPVMQMYPKAVEWPELGAKRVKVRYGPYRIPPVSEKNLESEFWKIQGMSQAVKFGATRPCQGDCTILYAATDLEYADGSPANNSNGAWFHHTVLLNSGPQVVEPTCGQSLVESFFLTGNERTQGGYALHGTKIKSGFKLKPQDQFIMQTELMNLENKEKWVWQTITFEYLDGPQPEFKNGKTIWLTIGTTSNPGLTICTYFGNNPFGATNLTSDALPKAIRFSEHSKEWVSKIDGQILRTGGHMHEGGTSVEMVQNGKKICQSIPNYTKDAQSSMAGDAPSSGSTGGHSHSRRQIKAGNYSNADIMHIANQTLCDFPAGIPLKKGDNIYIQANYDFDVYPGMKNKEGLLDQVMGIVGFLVAF